MENRILCLDYMKALAIFFVVLGHLIDGVDSETNPFRIFIYSLHMPLFFIVSGFLSSKKITSIGNLGRWYLRKMRLLIPFFVFSIGDVLILGSSWDAFLGWNKYGLWFLWTLFLFDTIYAITQLVLISNKNKKLELIGLIAPVLVCIALRRYDNTLLGGIFNFMQLYNYAFFILGVIVVRYGLQKYILDERIQFLMLLMYIVGLTTGIAALNIPMKACGILLVYAFFEKISASRNSSLLQFGGGKINNLILSFGQHTLYIYILHFYLIRGNLSLPVSAHIILFSAPFYYLTIYSVFSIVIMWICVQVADFLNTNKYIRMYVFGSRK